MMRAAESQSLFREVNERVKQVNDGFATVGQVTEWVCECTDTTCTQRVPMTLDEYDGVRGGATRFVVAPGHASLDVEVVIATTDRYVVVEKIGRAADIAWRLDPRRSAPGTHVSAIATDGPRS